MKLQSIELRNFGSFTDATIDLTAIAAAVVTGNNGAGKSTCFVDAPLWALFGKCRTGTDQMLQLGAVEMAVTIEFLLNGQRYRVIRKRSLVTKAGKSELSLQLANGDGWQDASGSRLADTQQKIVDLLNSDYELLVATGVLVQGQADRFSRATPTERKAILAQILRLDQYGPLKQAANRHLTIADTKHMEKQSQLAMLELEASTLAGAEARQLEVTAALEESRKAIEQLEQHQQDLTTTRAGIAAELEQLQTIPQQITDLQGRQGSLLKDRATKTMRKEQAVAILANRQLIEESVKDAARLREWEQTLGQEFLTISADLASANQALQAEHDQLDALPAEQTRVRSQRTSVQEQRDALLIRRERTTKILGNRATIEAKVEEEKTALVRQRVLEDEARTCQDDLDETATFIDRVNQHLLEGAQLHTSVGQIERRTDDLVSAYERETICLGDEIAREQEQTKLLTQVPCGADLQKVCKFTLTAAKSLAALPDKLQRYANRWGTADAILEHVYPDELKALTEARAKEALWQEQEYASLKMTREQQRATFLETQVRIKRDLESVKQELALLAKFTVLVPELAASEREVAQIDLDLAQRATALKACEDELDILEKRIRDRSEAIQAVEIRIQELTARRDANDTERQSTKTSLSRLALFTDMVPQLAAAEREVTSVEQDLAKVAEELASVDQQLSRLQLRLDDRVRLTTEHSRLSAEWQQDQNYLVRLRADGQTAVGRLKELELEIKRAQDAGRQAEELRGECDRLRVDGSHFQTLITAYAQIPVLILESSIPLLEEEANKILGKISPSGMRVRLDTQKALKSRDGLAETLEIVVRDVYGERPYENYSGGEKFRLDLALRIGLSKLLANRAGAKLETLIIDEGLGSLDEDGLAQLRECLATLQAEFPLVLVITHVEAMKHTFPSQLVVSKNGSGSRVDVVA